MPIEQHIYTSCPSGQGYDKIDGFQTKARSPGLTDATTSLIRHYCGRYLLPRSAQEIEYTFRRAGRHVPSHALGHFPIALTYYPIADDIFALTRTCYRGQDHSGRFGSFFAHTLVFPVEALRPLDYNPLALTRTHLFQSTDSSDRTALPTLPDFQHLQVLPDHSWMSLATQEPYAEQLVHLLSATSRIPQTRRPVILCLPRWEHAAPLIEALLMLVPSEVRCRLTFTTYEHDPYRLQGLGAATSQSARLPLQVVVTLSRAEGGAFKFDHDEYHTQFAIFNFAERHFSPQSSPSTYAQYVADCCRHGRLDRLDSVQKLLTDMEIGRQPAQWDSLLPAVHLQEPFDPQHRGETLRQATSALLTVVQRPTQQELIEKSLASAGFSDAEHEIGRTIMQQGLKELDVDTAEQPISYYTHQKRDRNAAHTNGFRRLRRLAWVTGIVVFSLLGVGVVLQSVLVGSRLKEDTTKSVASPAVTLPHNPAWREQPMLPHRPVWREQPMLP